MKICATTFALLTLVGLQAVPAQAVEFTSIQTPSGNIHCTFGDDMDGNIDCEIIEVTTQSPDLPAKPASCDLDYGTRFFMEREGNPTMPCHGDTVRNPKGSVIPYGGSFALHGITCVSEETGLTCSNEDGHGFRLSKARQELF